MTKTTPSDFRLQTSDFILVKDYSFLVIELFLASGHSLRRFPPRFLAFWLPKNISLNSDDKKSTEHTELTQKDVS